MSKILVCGERTYTATVTFLNTTYTDKAYEPIDEKGHDWDEPTYEWKAIPGGYTCTATRVCKNDTALLFTNGALGDP